jgi:UDP-N-acetylglucosamine--N-acetylmuramyl-(pentapeptide) pyrophosphoryl-undecaprenol N-acetylglucosamine transferase
MKRILFTGGGSAGHVVPNLALMNELKYTHRISYVGTGGIEKTLVGKSGYPFFQVDCPKLARSFTLQNLKIPFRLQRAKKEALSVLQREQPDLVFSKGGFASYPAVWAARKLKIPVFTHESDLSPGLCTKLIAKKCKYVLTSFPETAEKFKNGKCVGSPIRKEILNGETSRARRKYGFTDPKPVLLVLGGGSGSRALNEAILTHFADLTKRFQILHLCGKGNAAREKTEDYLPLEFESDMASAYACADVVLSRAGSNTVFEILALKKPAVFVPLERGSRGDQVENAEYFERKELCTLLRESELASLPAVLFATLESKRLKSALAEYKITSGTPAVLDLIKAELHSAGASV